MERDSGEQRDLEILMTECPELFKRGKTIMFQRFLCPISIVDADVKEYVVDEYDSVELLVLRLYSIGLRSANVISKLTGIDIHMIEKLLFAEIYTYGHIDPETKELTLAGMETLKENIDSENLFQHAMYNVKRELQVDSLTGALIRADAEIQKNKMVYYSDAVKPNLMPKEWVVIDAELEREIQERLQLYIDKGYFTDGNTINQISRFRTKEIKYRYAFFVYIENFRYPFIAISYIHYVNGKPQKLVAPIAISESDFKSIDKSIEECTYLVRPDNNFDYLKSLRNQFANCPDMDEETFEKIMSDEQQEEHEPVIEMEMLEVPIIYDDDQDFLVHEEEKQDGE